MAPVNRMNEFWFFDDVLFGRKNMCWRQARAYCDPWFGNLGYHPRANPSKVGYRGLVGVEQAGARRESSRHTRPTIIGMSWTNPGNYDNRVRDRIARFRSIPEKTISSRERGDRGSVFSWAVVWRDALPAADDLPAAAAHRRPDAFPPLRH